MHTSGRKAYERQTRATLAPSSGSSEWDSVGGSDNLGLFLGYKKLCEGDFRGGHLSQISTPRGKRRYNSHYSAGGKRQDCHSTICYKAKQAVLPPVCAVIQKHEVGIRKSDVVGG